MDFDKVFESIKTIKLTGGLFGKIILFLIVLCITIGIVSIEMGNLYFAVGLMLSMIGLAGYTLKRCFDFADRNPQAAIMEGADLLTHERIFHETKGNTEIPIHEAIIDHPQPYLSIEEINKDDPPQTPSLDAPNPDEGTR